jgi:hypothetical protein
MATGVAIDRSHYIDYRSLWGYMLARALMPQDTSRTAMTHQFVRIVYLPGLYQEYVQGWNRSHPPGLQVPFFPTANTITLRRVPPQMVENFQQRSLLDFMCENRIPVAWIHHAYPFAIWWVRQQLLRGNTSWPEWQDDDTERLRRLAQYGVPPAFRPWRGWYIPTRDDVVRISWLRDQELAADHDYYHDPGWMNIGEDVIFTYMPGVNATFTVPPGPPTQPQALQGFTGGDVVQPQDDHVADDEDMGDLGEHPDEIEEEDGPSGM